jgi:hypothetical protein
LECLTGRRVYAGPPSEVIARRLAEPVPIPAALPGAWRDLLGRMVEHLPELRPGAAEVSALLCKPEYGAPWDPWGQPVGVEVPETMPLAAAGGGLADRTDVYGAGPAPLRAGRRRRSFALAALAAVAVAALLVAWASGVGSKTRAPTRAPAVSTTVPASTTVPVASTPAVSPSVAAMATLTQDVNAGVSAGTLANDTATALTNDAQQAVIDAGAGNAADAVADLQRAATRVAAGVQDGSVTPAEAGLLQRDLAALGSALGLGAVTTTPTTAAGQKGHGDKAGNGGNGD